jgi:hypothetical protein
MMMLLVALALLPLFVLPLLALLLGLSRSWRER